MSNVPVPQRTLDQWARFTDEIRFKALDIRSDVACGHREKAREELIGLHLDAAAALSSMREAGANLPDYLPRPDPVPLDLLDTSANRRLARALREAYEAAQEVDKERGTYDPDEPEDGPTALPIVELLARVEEEVFGPSGSGEGAGR